MLESGEGCGADVHKAISWYQLAAEQGDYARAQNCLGVLYYRGKSSLLAPNHQLAVKWFRRAAKQGFSHAQNNLGICYEDGLGAARGHVFAEEYYG